MSGNLQKLIDRIFSGKYTHRNVNFVQIVMYRIAYPFAVMLNKLHLSPNQITTASLLFAILAFVALVFDNGWVWFSIFWGLSVLLDVCDGTVARMANKVSKSAFRYDHMSDLFKVSLIVLGIGIRYDNSLIWILAFSACFTFLYADAVNRELGIARSRQVSDGKESPPKSATRRRDKYPFVAWVVKYDLLVKLYKNIFAVLFTINGHTLLLFFIFPFGPEITIWGLCYLIIIGLWAIRSRISRLVVMRR